jgi:hypothetical protein
VVFALQRHDIIVTRIDDAVEERGQFRNATHFSSKYSTAEYSQVFSTNTPILNPSAAGCRSHRLFASGASCMARRRAKLSAVRSLTAPCPFRL